MERAKIISVINWKGGVGKTTLTHHLGTGFAHLTDGERMKYLGTTEVPRVLLIDNDAQCSLSVSCLEEQGYGDLILTKKVETIANLYIPFLENEQADVNVRSHILKWSVRRQGAGMYPQVDLLPSHQDLIYTDMDIAMYSPAGYMTNMKKDSRIYKCQVLHNMLEQVRDDYDFIFIDCPPNLNYITQNAFYVSDYYLIPTHLDLLSIYGLTSITGKVTKLNELFGNLVEDYKPVELIGIVPNRVKEYNKEPKGSQSNILKRLYESYGDMVFQNYVTEGDGISSASQMGFPVYGLTGSGANAKKQADAMQAVLCEMLERI
ncbi:MAG: ParA family protein [Bacillota bacterium]|nr:ParA family protein [Bacillota bacterium]